MLFLSFVAATAAMIVAYEILSKRRKIAKSALEGYHVAEPSLETPTPSLLQAIAVALFPNYLTDQNAKRHENIIDLLRRTGYAFQTPGEFYAYAVRVFIQNAVIGTALAAVCVLIEIPEIAPLAAGFLIYDGLKKPYRKLNILAKKRAQAFRNNMLAGLSTMKSLLEAGVGVQEAMRRTAEVGGPFCNFLLLIVSRMELDQFTDAMEIAYKHLPDPKDVEAVMFLKDLESYFVYNRELLPAVSALQENMRRIIVEETESRAALVKQRASLYGVFAVIGMLITLIIPFVISF
jgi:Flp pilus assembly protein TadB